MGCGVPAREIIAHHVISATLFALGFLAIGATVGAYLLGMIAVERLQAADAAVYFYIQAIAGAWLSVV